MIIIGLLEDKRITSLTQSGVDLSKKLYEQIPSYKKKAKQYELTKVKQDIAEEAAEAKRKDLNLSIEEWKNRYLYPFGNILPMPDIKNDRNEIDSIQNMSTFEQS